MRPLVKICGLTNYEDAALALELGADALGFVLAPSKRRVSPEMVSEILARLRSRGLLEAGRAEAIAVFVNEDPARMAEILSRTGLDRAQIHGDEDPEACDRFVFPWYRALRAASPEGAILEAFRGWAGLRLLFDAAVDGAYGGTGSSVPRAIAVAARDATRASEKEFFLAGGIGPGNVAEIIESVGPDGLDVSSGVEEGPGKKSRAAMERLFAEISRATGKGGKGRVDEATR